MLVTTPADGAEVWTRLTTTGYPFTATWSASEQTWTADNGLVIPWYYCPLWREL